MTTSRHRSSSVTVGAIALSLGALGGCSSGSDYRGVCVDRATNVRVDDDRCDEGRAGGVHGWYFLRSGTKAPAVGGAVAGGSFTTPGGSSSTGGVDRAGGTVDRGGFGFGHGSFGG